MLLRWYRIYLTFRDGWAQVPDGWAQIIDDWAQARSGPPLAMPLEINHQINSRIVSENFKEVPVTITTLQTDKAVQLEGYKSFFVRPRGVARL